MNLGHGTKRTFQLSSRTSEIVLKSCLAKNLFCFKNKQKVTILALGIRNLKNKKNKKHVKRDCSLYTKNKKSSLTLSIK